MDTVDLELDRLISKRASQDLRPDPDEREELWQKSVDAHNEKRRQMARLEWHAFHCGQAARGGRTGKRFPFWADHLPTRGYRRGEVPIATLEGFAGH